MAITTAVALENRLGPEAALLFLDLETECDWLQHKWAEFSELYGEGPERLDLLNRVAPNFFYLIKQALYENVMLHLSRLTDPEKSSGKENLTMKKLSSLITDPSLKIRVGELALEAEKKCHFARKWRNKWLAHRDLAAHRRDAAEPLPQVAVENIRMALASLNEILSVIRVQCGVAPVVFGHDPWGATALLHHLERSTKRYPVPDRTTQR